MDGKTYCSQCNRPSEKCRCVHLNKPAPPTDVNAVAGQTDEEIARRVTRQIHPRWHHPEYDALARDTERLILAAITEAKSAQSLPTATGSAPEATHVRQNARELIQRFRKEASRKGTIFSPNAAYDHCANLLEAALSPPPPLLAQTAKDSGEKEEPSDNVEHVRQKELCGWLKPQCSRLIYGQCSTRKCLVRGGWKPGPATNYDLATCEPYEISVLLDSGSPAAGASSPNPPVLAQTLDTERLERQRELKTAISMTDDHDRDGDGKVDEHDCFCIRCCAIRFLAAMRDTERLGTSEEKEA